MYGSVYNLACQIGSCTIATRKANGLAPVSTQLGGPLQTSIRRASTWTHNRRLGGWPRRGPYADRLSDTSSPVAKDLRIPGENSPLHRQFSTAIPPSPYLDAYESPALRNPAAQQ